MLIQQVSPPHGRQYLRVCHGDDRGAGQEALVVVPHIGAIALFGVDHGDLFETFAQVGIEGVNFGLAEVPGNRQVLLGP